MRTTATLRACGYGALGSANESLPSSTRAISPNCLTGAKTALRVPSTIRAWPREMARYCRYRAALPSSAESEATHGPNAACNCGKARSNSRAVGTTTMTERSEAKVAAAASMTPTIGSPIASLTAGDCRKARGDSPAPSRRRSASPPGNWGSELACHVVRGAAHCRWADFSVVAWRGGTASRATSEKVPA